MEEEIICNRHRDLADAVMNAVPPKETDVGHSSQKMTAKPDNKSQTKE